ncbi:unnamed protein product, partial [Pylaiella littoralis]
VYTDEAAFFPTNVLISVLRVITSTYHIEKDQHDPQAPTVWKEISKYRLSAVVQQSLWSLDSLQPPAGTFLVAHFPTAVYSALHGLHSPNPKSTSAYSSLPCHTFSTAVYTATLTNHAHQSGW